MLHYRAEIDGLRAVAVLPVILFHAGSTLFSGGYVGVDIFFVISGYLITDILLKDLEGGKFSIARFYERRARRILPALTVVVLCSLPAAWFLLLPETMEQFAASVAGVGSFTSNFVFWLQSGYFDEAAELKPLLHTWSLAVEEQYYIVYPLLLAALWRYGTRVIFSVLLLITLASLALAHWMLLKDPAAAFFLFPTRAWELALGGLCALYLRYWERRVPAAMDQVMAVAGLVLIGYAVVTFDDATPTPSIHTLVPTVGAVLIILFAKARTLVARLLSLAPVVAIGLISYSAYLWHQPVLAFLRIHSNTMELSLAQASASIAVTLLLAAVTWRWVEQPFRRRSVQPVRIKWYVPSAGALVAVATVGVGLYLAPVTRSDQLLNFEAPSVDNVRVYESTQAFERIGIERTSKWNAAKAFVNTEAPAEACRILAMGDSHAWRMGPFLRHVASETGCEAHIVNFTGCPPLFDHYKVYHMRHQNYAPRRQAACKAQTEVWEQHLRDRDPGYSHVLLASRWNWLVGERRYASTNIREDAILPHDVPADRVDEIDRVDTLAGALRRTVDVIGSVNAKTIVIGQIPVQLFDVKDIRSIAELREVKPPMAKVRERQRAFDRAVERSGITDNPAVTYIRSIEFLCDLDAGACRNTDGRNALYWDDDHFSAYGSFQFAGWVLERHPGLFGEVMVSN